MLVSNPIRESQNEHGLRLVDYTFCFKPYKGKSKSPAFYRGILTDVSNPIRESQNIGMASVVLYAL